MHAREYFIFSTTTLILFWKELLDERLGYAFKNYRPNIFFSKFRKRKQEEDEVNCCTERVIKEFHKM